MARTMALLTTLLLTALAATASAEPRRALAEIAAACEYATIPQLCTSLAQKTGATTLDALTVAAINEVLTIAQDARATIAKTQRGTADAKLKASLHACGDSYDHAIESLQKGASGMKSGAPYSGPVLDISAAINYIGNCQDTFSENPGLVSPVADVTSVLKKLVSNSLALAVALELKTTH